MAIMVTVNDRNLIEYPKGIALTVVEGPKSLPILFWGFLII